MKLTNGNQTLSGVMIIVAYLVFIALITLGNVGVATNCQVSSLRGVWALGWSGVYSSQRNITNGLGVIQIVRRGRVARGWIMETRGLVNNATFANVTDGNVTIIDKCFAKLYLLLSNGANASFLGVIANNTQYFDVISAIPGNQVLGQISRVKRSCNATSSLRGVWGTATHLYANSTYATYTETLVCRRRQSCDSYDVTSAAPDLVSNQTQVPHEYVRGFQPCGYFRFGQPYEGRIAVPFGDGMYQIMDRPSLSSFFAKYYRAKF